MKALILSGGLSSGLVPLTINTPKPLLPIGNYPLILFQVSQLKKAGITEIILSLSYQPRLIRDILDDGSNFGVLLRYHVESTPLGTAGAFKVAEHLVDGTTLVLNGDILSEMAFEQCLETHRKHGGPVTIATCSVANPRSYGVVGVGKQGRVTAFHREASRQRGAEQHDQRRGVRAGARCSAVDSPRSALFLREGPVPDSPRSRCPAFCAVSRRLLEGDYPPLQLSAVEHGFSRQADLDSAVSRLPQGKPPPRQTAGGSR
ncbi:MAG: nucleotidyltransferase family protein [Acidobacteria bacterium]|nr:MAG: nucleotidyltransferase family protein [Acidobacteriota bacterium]